MHYYSQFKEREKGRKMACCFLLMFQSVFGPEGGDPGLGLLPIGGNSGPLCHWWDLSWVWERIPARVDWGIAPSGWKFTAPLSLEGSNMRVERSRWWMRLNDSLGTSQGDIWKVPYSISLESPCRYLLDWQVKHLLSCEVSGSSNTHFPQVSPERQGRANRRSGRRASWAGETEGGMGPAQGLCTGNGVGGAALPGCCIWPCSYDVSVSHLCGRWGFTYDCFWQAIFNDNFLQEYKVWGTRVEEISKGRRKKPVSIG